MTVLACVFVVLASAMQVTAMLLLSRMLRRERERTEEARGG